MDNYSNQGAFSFASPEHLPRVVYGDRPKTLIRWDNQASSVFVNTIWNSWFGGGSPKEWILSIQMFQFERTHWEIIREALKDEVELVPMYPWREPNASYLSSSASL